jgi:hypothetical protein
MAMTILNPYLTPTPAFAGWTKKIGEIRMNKLKDVFEFLRSRETQIRKSY